MTRHALWLTLLSLFALVAAACSNRPVANAQTVATPSPVAPPNNTEGVLTTPLPGNLDEVSFVLDNRSYSIRQLIPRDGIFPIYHPSFVSAENAPLNDNELVMGVEINGDARAYGVGVLRRREMVNDVVGGTPILATW